MRRLTVTVAFGCCAIAGAVASLAPASSGTSRPAQTSPVDPYTETGIVATRFRTSAARPRAGRRFTVSVRVVRTDTGSALASGRVSCTARAGGRSVRLMSRGLRRGWARCTWSVPRRARGQTLRGSIRVRAFGHVATRSFALRVR